jgi:hypothetical protein
LNNIPVSYPNETPAVIRIKPGVDEFWRVGNLAADTILDVQAIYDCTPQTLTVVGPNTRSERSFFSSDSEIDTSVI